jgi:signal transduction histidine kinase
MLAASSQILLVIFLVVSLIITYSFYATEKQTWHDRQQDALLVSESTINSFLDQINNSLILAASVDKDYVRSHPKFLSEFLAQQSSLQEVIFVDPQGQIYGSAFRDEPVLSNVFTISQSAWFSSAIQGSAYISHVYFSSTSDPYLIVSVPSPHGVVVARLRLDVLRDVVLRVRLGHTGNVYIIDQNGEMIAASNANLISQDQSFLDRPEVQSAISQGTSGWQGTYTNFSGQKVLGETTSLFDNKWIIFVEIPRKEAFATTSLVAVLIFVGALLVFAIVMLVTNSALVRYIFKPIEILRKGTIQIGEGDLDHRITFSRQDEIAMVADAFNEMAQKLRLREVALDDAVKQAVDANRYKSQMLAHVSHDLRTPLSGIAGFAEILVGEVDGKLNAEQKDTAERILANGKRLRDMVETLLDQAQLERGTLTLQNNTFTSVKFVEPLHVAYGIMARSKALFLEVEIKPDFPAILRGDMLRLQEVLTNLVDNGIKFTRKGGITVTLFCPDDSHWAFSVTDTGTGIPIEAQEYIFEPFRQVDGSARTHSGAGLGLSIVKQIVELMGGTISVHSQTGKGATFTATLPLRKGDE